MKTGYLPGNSHLWMACLSSSGSDAAVMGVLLKHRVITTYIEEHRRCFGLDGYFMAAVLAAARYSRIGFIPCHSVRTRRLRVPGGGVFHLEPGIINNLIFLLAVVNILQMNH